MGLRRYAPRGAARKLLSCRDGEVLIAGPAGTGKSMGALYKMHLAAMKYPNMRGLLVRKTAASLGSTTLDTWRKHVISASIISREVSYYGGSTEEPAQYRYHRNKSVMVIGGMDKPSKIMSSEYDLVFADEGTEFVLPDWEAMTSRLRNNRMPYSQLIAACNPDAEHHWLKQRANSGLTTMMESRHVDNPAYFNADGTMTERGAAYMARLDSLTGVRYKRLRLGLWVSAEGMIYEEYDPAIHLIDRFDIPDDWVRWWSVDFGFTNPMVVQFWAEDGDGRLYLYREIYHTGRLVEDVARQILEIVQYADGEWREPRPRAIICDHDAEDRATLERHLGMSTTAAVKTVSDGLQAVAVRLRRAGDGKPRLFMLRDSLVRRDPSLSEAGKPTCTPEEITGYVWARGPDGKPAKEEPEKKDDHGMDTTRYVVAERDLRGRPSFRAMRRR